MELPKASLVRGRWKARNSPGRVGRGARSTSGKDEIAHVSSRPLFPVHARGPFGRRSPVPWVPGGAPPDCTRESPRPVRGTSESRSKELLPLAARPSRITGAPDIPGASFLCVHCARISEPTWNRNFPLRSNPVARRLARCRLVRLQLVSRLARTCARRVKTTMPSRAAVTCSRRASPGPATPRSTHCNSFGSSRASATTSRTSDGVPEGIHFELAFASPVLRRTPAGPPCAHGGPALRSRGSRSWLLQRRAALRGSSHSTRQSAIGAPSPRVSCGRRRRRVTSAARSCSMRAVNRARSATGEPCTARCSR